LGARPSDHIAYSGISDLAHAFSAGELTSVEATQIALARFQSINPRINAFSQIDEQRALSLAEASDRRRRNGTSLGPLDGIPFSVKDTLVAEGFATRRGSKITSEEPARESSPAVARVLEAGGVILGITTTPEFGGGPVTISPLTGITRNAWDVSKTAGGSSGGAATSIAAGIGAFALATDAGGSIRNPAALNGVVGYKATGGLVPTWPANVAGALSSSGPIARSVADCAAVLAIITRADGRDPDSLPPPADDFPGDLQAKLPALRIAVSETLGYARHVDAAVLTVFRRACGYLETLGATVDLVDPPIVDPIPIYTTLFSAGFAATLRKLSPADRQQIGSQLQALLVTGGDVTLEQYFAAQQARRELAVQMHRFHQTYDLLITPMVAVTAFDAERMMPASFEQYDEPRAWVPFSYPFNLTQQPAISIPCGFSDEGLPVGLQVVGPRFSDRLVLQFAAALEGQGIAPVRRPSL
jgi:aspartyl-tRNA(Asn)/glutamyl-tRNA(Gln) amidotransferase subunit A